MIHDNIKNEKLQYNINREAVKNSVLLKTKTKNKSYWISRKTKAEALKVLKSTEQQQKPILAQNKIATK